MTPKSNKNSNEAFTLKVSNESAMIGVGIVLIAIIVWTITFKIIEWWDWFHSIYYVAVTISTIGYGDIVPVTHTGKVLTIIYALVGVPLFIFAAGLIIEARIRWFVVTHLHHHQQQINRLKAQNRKEDKAIAEITDDMEEVSESIEWVTDNMEEVVAALDKAQRLLKRKK